MHTYDVLEQLARDRCRQREAEGEAERLELPVRTRRSVLATALALLAWTRRQTANA